MAWGTCRGGVWERLQVRLENGIPQLVMDLDPQLKNLVVYFVMVAVRIPRGLTLLQLVPGTALGTLHTSHHFIVIPTLKERQCYSRL